MIRHAEAMLITASENTRLLDLLRRLTGEQWQATTDCTGWTVRDIAVHLIASAQAQAHPLEFARQLLAGRRLGGAHWVDGLNQAQLLARTGWEASTLPPLWAQHSAAALKARRRLPAPIRALPILPLGTGLGVHIGWQSLGYLFGMGFTRDVWMHRIDIARAAGIEPSLTAAHDGRIVADIVDEWSGRHGQPYTLTLTGPAGGSFQAGDRGEPQSVDAVEFARILSGRADGPGILRHKLPL
ncbi:maleylpyruvate isomerase family mycothiol-dependent enzyme [Paractinoplanes lichenicola]|uniref:Maleylpyruvate isomerase family mycothiol-dependent enzyme n=1 Tax=Paractinoplanes lichenicola TaxID=2802976 RepID=A0ABS1VYA4_9ACTN|nr:maleylpyruvate isomerase family mycothiol-dependent enzyme [Actinoplanes lichenicola]MBL7259435.1 maleylpyruvate isomerase family mycothiol-dependent enzyme [Actinoplanes lichenicola]